MRIRPTVWSTSPILLMVLCIVSCDSAGSLATDARNDSDAAVSHCNGTSALSPPELLTPHNGDRTGRSTLEESVRPTFVWRMPCPGLRYTLEVDDSCGENFHECEFPSPEVRAVDLESAVFRPVVSLPVSGSIGRRYYWRVRACLNAACSAWSATRYLNVGRQTQDVNGDGFSDIVVGALDSAGQWGRFHVFAGGESPDAVADLVGDGDSAGGRLGSTVSVAADMNGDGYSEILVGGTGQLRVYLGGPDYAIRPPLHFSPPAAGSTFGTVFGVGDMDGDGYDDVVVGAYSLGRAYLYRGGATLDLDADMTITGEDGGVFGGAVGGVGDVNGDGFADFVVAAPWHDGGGTDSGRVFLYLGGSQLDSVADWSFSGDPGRFLGSVSNTPGDADGDGYMDLLIGQYGKVHLFRGGRVIGAAPSFSLIARPFDDVFGFGLAFAGDVLGIGSAQILVGDFGHGTRSIDAGRCYLFAAGVHLDEREDLVFDGDKTDDWFGHAVGGAGDVNGDGHDDFVVGAPRTFGNESDFGRAYLFLGGPNLFMRPDLVFVGDDLGGRFGGTVAAPGERLSRQNLDGVGSRGQKRTP